MIVKGRGDPEARVLLLGEKPGVDELRHGKVWIGRAGVELDKICWKTGVDLENVWLDNLIQDAPTGEEGEVTDADIARNQEHLTALMAKNFDLIVPMGASAVRYVLSSGVDDDVRSDLGTVHGLVLKRDTSLVLPTWHPAAGLHDGDSYPFIDYDFRRVAAVIKGKWDGRPEERIDKVGTSTKYTVISNSDRDLRFMELLFERRVYTHIFLDTEEDGWCLTFALEEGEGYLIHGWSKEAIEKLAYLVGINCLIAVLHFAPHDIPVLRGMGWDLIAEEIEIEDTAIAAYLLQIEPQGLKSLGYRHCGMVMKDYLDLVTPYSLDQRIEYLVNLSFEDWGKPEPYIEEKKNETKLHQPQGLNTRITKILNALEKEPGTDIMKWWKGLHENVNGAALATYGPPPTAKLGDVPYTEAMHYACRDADATGRVYWKLMQRLTDMGLWDTFKMDCAVIPHIEEMMTTGFGVDVPYFKNLIVDWRAKQGQIRKKIADRIGRFINPESSPQVAHLLFNEMRLPVYKETAGGAASTADKAIDWLKTSDRIRPEAREMVQLIGDHRELDKGVTSFASPIIQFASASTDGRLHGDLKYTRVVSGRFSMAEPNLLAMPVRSALGKLIRGGFVSRPGYILGSWDLNQIEMRFMAHESGDEDLIQAYLDGKDIHKETATRMFGCKVEEVTDEQREVAKRISFGVITGIQGSGLKDQFYLNGITKYSEADCNEFIAIWFNARPRVQAYIEGCRGEARRFGYVRESIGGRIRYLQGVHSTSKKTAAESERASHSHRISSGAQAILKKGMDTAWPTVAELRRADEVDIRWILQVHDELILEFPDGYQEVLDSIMTDAMCNTVKLRVPVKVNRKFATNWGKLK